MELVTHTSLLIEFNRMNKASWKSRIIYKTFQLNELLKDPELDLKIGPLIIWNYIDLKSGNSMVIKYRKHIYAKTVKVIQS